MAWVAMRYRSPVISAAIVFLAALLAATSGCNETDTLKREVLKRVRSQIHKTKEPFTPKDGITIRSCSLYQAANPNSELVRKLPAETPVHLIDRVGEWYRVRTRDGREGYLEQKMVGGEEIIRKTHELRKSIEGIPVQAEGVIKSKANFRLDAGRSYPVLEVLPPGKRLEMYERVVTPRKGAMDAEKNTARGKADHEQGRVPEVFGVGESGDESGKKDVWYKVKIEDGRVGYIYTHNLAFTPPDDIARMVPFMRVLAWRAINTTDDPDQGTKNNFLVACAPIGKDAGCDYTRLYFVNWAPRVKRHVISWQLRLNGILPITDFRFEGRPGFSVRSLHPTKRDKLVLANYSYTKGTIQKVSEEEMPHFAEAH